MTLAHSDPWLDVHVGDCRAVLPTLPECSVHMVVTSPPYWGLRDYGVDGQLGMEARPDDYVAAMVEVFRDVRRVLRDDGTLWLNLGDTYWSTGGAGGTMSASGLVGGHKAQRPRPEAQDPARFGRWTRTTDWGLKQKDIVGIPWRVAFALQADGWWLRRPIIWSKPNPMPESVDDRPTASHEYLFLLSKSERYFYDAEAVKEPLVSTPEQYARAGRSVRQNHAFGSVGGTPLGPSSFASVPDGRNLRDVWTIPTRPYPGAHFAVFPPDLVVPCIKAGTSERGVCPVCGAPWRRRFERVAERPDRGVSNGIFPGNDAHGTRERDPSGAGGNVLASTPRRFTGWEPTCDHADVGHVNEVRPPATPVPATVLDPFGGSGTTAMVAQSLSRRAILIELNPDYLDQTMGRNTALPMGL